MRQIKIDIALLLDLFDLSMLLLTSVLYDIHTHLNNPETVKPMTSYSRRFHTVCNMLTDRQQTLRDMSGVCSTMLK